MTPAFSAIAIVWVASLQAAVYFNVVVSTPVLRVRVRESTENRWQLRLRRTGIQRSTRYLYLVKLRTAKQNMLTGYEPQELVSDERQGVKPRPSLWFSVSRLRPHLLLHVHRFFLPLFLSSGDVYLHPPPVYRHRLLQDLPCVACVQLTFLRPCGTSPTMPARSPQSVVDMWREHVRIIVLNSVPEVCRVKDRFFRWFCCAV